MSKISLFLGGMGMLFFAPFSAFAAENLDFAFGKSCPVDAEKCIPEIFSENENEFFLPEVELGKTLQIDLVVRNPKAEMITSARAKLKYDPKKIDVLKISTDESDFPLFAPGEKDINQEKGTILLGGSFTSGSKSDVEFIFATITLKPKVFGAKLEFLNFQQNELGDTGVLYTQGIETENRLQESPKPLLIGKTIKEKATAPQADDPVPIDKIPDFPMCERPTGLRIQTDTAGKVRLLWPLPTEECVVGYFVYYSQKSGFYIRRRDVGKTNFIEIEDLEKDKRYCFALTSYDSKNTETDYSDEVCVVVGQPGTETIGFVGDPRNQQPETPPQTEPPKTIETGGKVADSGPATSVFFLLLLSAGMTMVGFAFRRQKN